MSKHPNRRTVNRIKFGIGTKLILIISIIIIASLGSITALVSYLVHEDLRIMAEESNFEANRNAAAEAEALLVNARADSRVLIQAAETAGDGEKANQTAEVFFIENPYIGAVFYFTADRTEQIFKNERFFISRNIDSSLAETLFAANRPALARAIRGETVVLNATPVFGRAMMILFFPIQSGNAGAVIFTSENLNNNFGFGLNLSYMGTSKNFSF